MSAKKEFTKQQIEDIIQLYTIEKMSLKNIGKKYNVSDKPIKRILQENQVHMISASERRREDLTGQRFGKLTVIELDPNYIPESGKHAKWLCQCDCGNIVSIQSNHLKDGTQSACSPVCNHKIESGTVFGRLTVIEPTEERSPNGGSVMYLCQCECGNYTKISSTELRAGRKKQCDECSDSYGENKIASLLESNGIDYIKEYSFVDCINPETKHKLRFDFYLPQYNFLIECDGIQHFQSIEYWGGEEGFQKRQQLDNIKNIYCKEHGITLIRIPYIHLDDLIIEDLLEDSLYKVKNDD